MSPLRTALDLIAIALIGLYVVTFVARNVTLQWDFDTCLLAARAAWAGLDPYRLEDLAAVAGKPVALPFVYPPIAIVPFFGLAALPDGVGAAAWIGFKAAILAGLVLAWVRWFVPGAGVLAIALLGVFGWNAAALSDLRTGNVALIECALLWSGFGCFVAGRRTGFAVLVLAASCFKLTSAAYLFLLLVPTHRRGPDPIRLLGSLATFAALVWAPLMVGPAAHWEGFLHNIPSAQALGEANPSSLALAQSLVERAGLSGPGVLPTALGLWAAYSVALLALSLPFLRNAWRMGDPRRWVMCAVFLDLLLAPRPMAYGFVRLGPAPLFFVPELMRRPGWGLPLALCLSAQGLARSAHYSIDSTLEVFSPFLLTLAVWLFVARGASMARASAPSLDPSPVLAGALGKRPG